MFDFRDIKIINLSDCKRISEDSNAYIFTETLTSQKYVLKFYEEVHPETDIYLTNEFRKLVRLSAEPEIASVYGLVTVVNNGNNYTGYLMDYIQGESLREFMNRDVIDYSIYVKILIQISTALEKCHQYNVPHNDLNFDNILFDVFGNIKLIDFFYDVIAVDLKNQNQLDITYYQKINEKLFNILEPSAIARAGYINNAIVRMTDFKELSIRLSLLDEISFDLSLIDDRALQFISQICADFEYIKMTEMLSESEMVIPEKLLSKITENELSYISNEKSHRYLDTRIERIRSNVKNYWFSVFKQLESLALATFEVFITTEKNFIGPYIVRLDIFISPKLIKLKHANDKYKFLPEIYSIELREYLFIDECFEVNHPTYL